MSEKETIVDDTKKGYTLYYIVGPDFSVEITQEQFEEYIKICTIYEKDTDYFLLKEYVESGDEMLHTHLERSFITEEDFEKIRASL